MYSNTAYEALYGFMGLKLQAEITRALTSATIFRALLLMIFAVGLFTFLVHFASRSMPLFLSSRRAPLSKLGGLMLGLFLGVSLLKVGGPTMTARNIAGIPWNGNAYLRAHGEDASGEVAVSLLFRLAVGSAEELARFLGVVVDRAFARTNSQMSAPNLFYKAVLGAASDTIDDPAVREGIRFFTDECLSQVLPKFDPNARSGFLDRLFAEVSPADQRLAAIPLESTYGPPTTCLEVKQAVNRALIEYTRTRSPFYEEVMNQNWIGQLFHGKAYENFTATSLLVNHYLSEREGTLGIEKGSELPGTAGRVFQYLNRFFSMEGILSVLGRRDLKGASVAAERSQELSNHLARAPHVAGFLKMLLIAAFPCLAFFLAAGRFRPMAWWWLTYLSICLWTPLWALLYHVVTALTLNLEVMHAFGEMSDGVSLYAASLISSRLYQAFAVYAWLQLLVGPVLTGGLLAFMRPVLADSAPDTMPQGVERLGGLATAAAGPAGKALGVLR